MVFKCQIQNNKESIRIGFVAQFNETTTFGGSYTGLLEAALQIIQWYLCRWQIEIYFKVLKSGCNIEKLQLSDKQRFDPCLAISLIIAWRILFLTMLGRASPSLNSECVFDTIEWQTAYVMIYEKAPPQEIPT